MLTNAAAPLVGRRLALACLFTAVLPAASAVAADNSAERTPAERSWPPLQVGDVIFNVTLQPDVFTLPDESLAQWIRRSIEVVSGYYGRFPVSQANLTLRARPGAGVKTGKMWGTRIPQLRVDIGERSTQAHLRRDWVLVHEMVHTAFPDVPGNHQWIEEGLAVYVESIARMRAGDLKRQQVWGEFVRRMPKGLPGPGDLGLDRTDTWGNRYWGGAIFCLVADVELYRQTEGRYGLRDALSGLVKAGLDNRIEMPMSRAMALADEVTGTHVLTELYEARRYRPVRTDLGAMWRALGVRAGNSGAVSFDEDAPEAWIRRSIESAS